MTAYIVLAAMVLAAGLLALLPVRLTAGYEHGIFTLTGRTGPVPVKLFPRKEATAEEVEKDVERDTKTLLERVPLPVLRLLAKSGCRVGGKLMRRVRVQQLKVHFLAAGPDPYRAVLAYARAGVAMEGISQLIPCADLHADVDFDGGNTQLEGQICVMARLGGLLHVGVCFGTDFLREYFRYKREKDDA